MENAGRSPLTAQPSENVAQDRETLTNFFASLYNRHTNDAILMDSLKVLPLHQYPQYLLDCCHLINEEWKRSDTARLRSLECSSDKLPTCLILLDEHNSNNKVIGHCKLSAIPSIIDACFIESVVIARELRGKGYGSHLMGKAEDYCKHMLQLNTIYLSTKGQEGFYKKLGYNICAPVCIFGGFTPNYTINNQKDHYLLKKHENNPRATNAVSAKTYMNKEI